MNSTLAASTISDYGRGIRINALEGTRPMAPPHRLRALSATVTASVVALVLLAGCSEEPEPRFTDSPTSVSVSPSETTPAEPAVPEPPTALDNGDAAGAKAAVRYYFKLWDYGLDTGDVGPLKKMGAPSCQACTRVAYAIAKSIRNGATVIGGRHRVLTIDLSRMQPRRKSDVLYLAESKVESSAQTIRNSGIKGLDGRYPQGTNDFIITVVFSKGSWRVGSWQT